MTPMYAKRARWLLRAAVGAGLAGVAAELAGVRALPVTVLVLIFIALAPATAIAGLLRSFDLFARLILTCVTSIALVTLIAMVMLAAGVWSPPAGLVAIALVSGGCVLAQHAAPIRTRIAARADARRAKAADGVSGQDEAAGPPAVEPHVVAADAAPGKRSRVRDTA